MKIRKIAVGLTGVCLIAGSAGAIASTGHKAAAAPSRTTIKQLQSLTMKPNQYVKDSLRWDKNVYRIKSGGTLHVRNSVITEGPHTFTVVKRSDLPTTAHEALENCKVCHKLEQAHGANPESDAPPKFFFLENGVGSQAPPKIDRPGDSALIGPGQKKTEFVDLKVTAKKGKTLYFMCIIHPWMQSKVIVG